jgi:hypothetical protein
MELILSNEVGLSICIWQQVLATITALEQALRLLPITVGALIP